MPSTNNNQSGSQDNSSHNSVNIRSNRNYRNMPNARAVDSMSSAQTHPGTEFAISHNSDAVQDSDTVYAASMNDSNVRTIRDGQDWRIPALWNVESEQFTSLERQNMFNQNTDPIDRSIVYTQQLRYRLISTPDSVLNSSHYEQINQDNQDNEEIVIYTNQQSTPIPVVSQTVFSANNTRGVGDVENNVVGENTNNAGNNRVVSNLNDDDQQLVVGNSQVNGRTSATSSIFDSKSSNSSNSSSPSLLGQSIFSRPSSRSAAPNKEQNFKRNDKTIYTSVSKAKASEAGIFLKVVERFHKSTPSDTPRSSSSSSLGRK